MKTIITISIVLLLTWHANAQVGLNTLYIKPSKAFGFVFKPTAGAELVFVNSYISERSKWRFSVGYFSLTPRQDSIPIWGILSAGQTILYPGYEIWKKYKVITFNIGYEYKLIDRLLSPIVGIDVGANSNSYEYQSTSLMQDESGELGMMAVTASPKLGVSYEFKERWLFTSALAKTFTYEQEYKATSYWRVQLGGVYYF